MNLLSVFGLPVAKTEILQFVAAKRHSLQIALTGSCTPMVAG